MRLKCSSCGKWHTMSPTGMGIVIAALVNGDLQRVTKDGVVSTCLSDAFASDTMKELKPILSAKHIIVMDGKQWDTKTDQWKAGV